MISHLLLPLNPSDQLRFGVCSGMLQHILQLFDPVAQGQLFTQICAFSALQARQSSYDDAISLHADIVPLLRRSQCYLTFHYDFYRFIPHMLLDEGALLVLILSKEVFENYRQVYGERWGSRLQFVLAEDPALFFKVRQALQRGYSLFCYVDGGKGVRDSAVEDKSMMEVSLLHATVRVRTGILALCALLKLSVVLLAIREMSTTNRKNLCVLAEYQMGEEAPARQQWVQESIADIYRKFALLLQDHPERWEGWLFAHDDLRPRSDATRWTPSQRYLLVQGQTRKVLVDRERLLFYYK